MKTASIIILIVTILLLSACQPSVDSTQDELAVLETEQQKRSYAMGASMGQIMQNKITNQKEMGVDYDQDLLVKGFIEALQNRAQLDKNEVISITKATDTLVKQKRIEIKAQMGKENKAKGITFLANNAKQPGIIVLDSGLQYKVLKNAEGPKPKVADTVTVHYVGTLLDGTEFDSSYSRNKPSTFPLNRVIKGWTEGVQLMSKGAKYKFFVPSELAYGARSTGKITSHSTLIFEVELLDIIEKK